MAFLLNIFTVAFIIYWYDYRYLWGSNWVVNPLMWRTNITPDNALSIVVITMTFFVMTWRLRQFKTNFLFAGIMTILMTILGIFYYEYFVLSILDIYVLQYLFGGIAISLLLIRYFTNKQIFRKFTRTLCFYFVPILMIPYVVWRYAEIPYGFWYYNAVLHKTSYFNDPWTHLWSIALWALDGVILIVMFTPKIFSITKSEESTLEPPAEGERDYLGGR